MRAKKVLMDVVEQKPMEVKIPEPQVPPQVQMPEPASTFLTRERREERRINMQPIASFNPAVVDESRRRLTWIGAVSAGVLIVGGFGLATALAKAVVTVTPRAERAPIEATLRVYPSSSTNQPHYEIVQVSQTESTKVPASGTKTVERKAIGTVTLYNEFSKQAVRIIPNTRFQTQEGKVYRSRSAVSVPGYKTVAGKTVAASVQVSVTADVAGAQYNIGPSSFTLPGLAGSLMAESVYAKSDGAMSGGFLGKVNIVSDTDLAKAKAQLEGTVAKKLLANIKSQVKENKIFFNSYSTDLIFNEYGEAASTTGKSGDDTKQQSVSMTGTATAIVFDKRELSTYMARRVLSGAGDADLLVGNWEELTAAIDQTTDLGTREDLSLDISGNALFVWQVNEEALKKDLAGIKKTEYTKVFLNYPAVNTAEVSISPFWSRSFPSNVSRIKITQNLPK